MTYFLVLFIRVKFELRLGFTDDLMMTVSNVN